MASYIQLRHEERELTRQIEDCHDARSSLEILNLLTRVREQLFQLGFFGKVPGESEDFDIACSGRIR